MSQELYLFKSNRLGFRNWNDKDIPTMAIINSNPDVMKFFPKKATLEETTSFIYKMQKMFLDKGYCYFAVDELSSGSLIGFIGLSDQVYKSEFTPCVDIGWRLDPKFWNNGYATEGAQACLSYAFNSINLNEIFATAPMVNTKSISVMKKIGMTKNLEFKHPRLLEHPILKDCVCYKITNPT